MARQTFITRPTSFSAGIVGVWRNVWLWSTREVCLFRRVAVGSSGTVVLQTGPKSRTQDKSPVGGMLDLDLQ